MNIWKISIQNIKTKPLYTFLSICILALSITLLLGIEQLKHSFKNQIETNLGKIDLVIGAKGSPLQLVLASVLHLDNPTGNISYSEAKEIGKNPRIKSAVPISYGDNYKGFRIVGTTNDFQKIYQAELETGRHVEKSMEVVLGATVAKTLNIKEGDTFLSSHGLVENSVDVHADELTVVGILKPTQKVIDRLIVTNLESVWDVHHHEEEVDENQTEHHHHHYETAEEEKEITSLLVTFKSPRALLTFPRKINESTNMLAALPKYELHKLYEYTSVGFQTISWIAYLILVMSCLTIFISLYKMVKERAFDLAILRTYGASNFQLIKMVLYEGVLIAFLAFALGFLLVKIGLNYVVDFIASKSQRNILQELPFQEVLHLGGLVLLMVIFSATLALYPIIKMNISTILSHEK
ncbi:MULTISPECIES: ABC transporter permease [Winogradskyella]|uniref:ABC transporter permease n=1 Tax=Winogradskyella TaxID=286104 RepID=UPI0015CC70FE|nr:MULTISPECIES: ABC transporter permease [Winogradskyella]QXP80320.1 ABC transporter permease [Winogradskyella sp. HaHa_3_26]